MLAIGIDTGGTCTDAVICDLAEKRILACAKSPTTHEQLEKGIQASLRKLPRELADGASYISLSTTLATNACVENKGGRVLMLFIGADRRTVEKTYADYGFSSTSDMRFLDADTSGSSAPEPDWSVLERELPKLSAEYDSFAVSQMNAGKMNGILEREAARRIAAYTDKPVVCAWDLFHDLNVIKRGAGAYLNARLIPVMRRFLLAVRNVLREEGLSLPVVIMRSDGSLVSEAYSLSHPVEALLCGPAASVKGAAALFGDRQAAVIDMGGTTTDIALIRDGSPLIGKSGTKVGRWQTFVRGADIDTFALGGDTRVVYRNNTISLDCCRVRPISSLAEEYPGILPELRQLAAKPRGSGRPLFEHLLLLKEPSPDSALSEEELRALFFLKTGPKSLPLLAEHLGLDPYQLRTGRLEEEGYALRCGFTPTDALLLLKEDGEGIPGNGAPFEAARLAAQFIANSASIDLSEYDVKSVAEETCRLVKERLYVNLVRILWQDSSFDKHEKNAAAVLEQLARDAFRGETAPAFFRCPFATDAVLLGVGTPVHAFLPDVARALHTEYRISPYSGVTNALGALLGDVCCLEEVRVDRLTVRIDMDEREQKTVREVHALSQGDDPPGTRSKNKVQYAVYTDETVIADSPEDAVRIAAECAERRAAEKARECGAREIFELSHKAEKKAGMSNAGLIELGYTVTGCARGRLF